MFNLCSSPGPALGTVCRFLPVRADDGAVSAGDTAWMLTATATWSRRPCQDFHLLRRPGAHKNVLSVFMQCVTITAIVSVLWIFYGYGLAFGEGGSWRSVIGSLDKAFLAGVRPSKCRRTSTRVRVRDVSTHLRHHHTRADHRRVCRADAAFSAVVAFTIAWFTLVYLPVVHWVWGGGWLMQLGVLGYAGKALWSM
jgi:Amt family ammonium transporter